MSLTTSIHALDDPGVDDRWVALSERSPLRSPFSEIPFLRAAAAAAEGLRTRIHFVEEDGQDVAGCALHWRRRGPYAEIVIPPFTAYSALLIGTPAGESEVHARSTPFDRLLKSIEASYDVLRIHLPPGVDDVRSAIWSGWSDRPLYTYVRDLDPAADPAHGWSSGTARTFRKHRDAYETIDPGSHACAALCAESYARGGRPSPLRHERLRRLIEDLSTEEALVRFGARHRTSGDVDASVAVLRQGRAAYYWVAGSRPGPAMTVLVGDMLYALASRGVEHFDFLGANTPSIAEFKRRFGCRLVRYHRLAHFTRKELKLLHALKQILH